MGILSMVALPKLIGGDVFGAKRLPANH